MRLLKGFLSTITLCSLITTASSCSVTKNFTKSREIDAHLQVYNQNVTEVYPNLDKSLSLKISTNITNEEIVDDSNLSMVIRKLLPKYSFFPSIKDFAQEATLNYLQKMQFNIRPAGNYLLMIDVKVFQLNRINKNETECSVVLNYKLTDAAQENVIPTRTASARINLGNNENPGIGLGRAYTAALEKINWSAIAKHLKVADNPQKEKNAMVSGNGDTALEHTVIRWYITSTPPGADVTWRVISSTPDVANTNSTFIGSTPYETTESFDIKGMTYNNAGNIQIEVTCEKKGYIPQRKRFNLRQAIDQKEISTKFNLIKEE